MCEPESNRLHGHATCWIQQGMSPSVLPPVWFSRLATYFSVYWQNTAVYNLFQVYKRTPENFSISAYHHIIIASVHHIISSSYHHILIASSDCQPKQFWIPLLIEFSKLFRDLGESLSDWHIISWDDRLNSLKSGMWIQCECSKLWTA